MDSSCLETRQVIDIVAPSSGNLRVDAQQIRAFINELGYVPRLSDDFQGEGADLFCANTDEIRLKNLIDALQNPESDIIWIYRGGYGASRLVTMLDKHDFSAHKKTIIGCSDITALALYFEKKYEWQFVHGRMISNFMDGSQGEDPEMIQNIISGRWNKIEYDLKPLNDVAKKTGNIISKITGGNLSLLQCSVGTNWQVEAKDKILFIEEVGEAAYAIDRMLTHLSQAGRFIGLKALIFGEMSKEPNDLIKKTLERFALESFFPVFEINNCGHGKINNPLFFNYDTQVISGDTASIIFENKFTDEN